MAVKQCLLIDLPFYIQGKQTSWNIGISDKKAWTNFILDS